MVAELRQTTPDATHSIMSWTSHLDGARHLLRMRKDMELQNGAAYRMFSILRVQIVWLALSLQLKALYANLESCSIASCQPIECHGIWWTCQTR